MINIEDDIFIAVKNALIISYPKISITNDASNTPSSFPHVTIVEENNTVYIPTRSNNVENHADLVYDINIYSIRQNGRKAECESIMEIIDDVMSKHNFTRNIKRPLPNMQDTTIYRIFARYIVIIGKDHTLYQK